MCATYYGVKGKGYTEPERSQALLVRHTCARLVTLVPGLCEILTHFSDVINSADMYNIHQSQHHAKLEQGIWIYLSILPQQLQPPACCSPTFSPSWDNDRINRSQNLERKPRLAVTFTTLCIFAVELVTIFHSGGCPRVEDTTVGTLQG
jgi:hypothetical protein